MTDPKKLPELPGEDYRQTLDDRGAIVAASPVDAIAVCVPERNASVVELIPFDCEFDEMEPSDWLEARDALYAPADLVLWTLDANGLNTTAAKLQVKLDRIREALTRGHETDEKAVDEALLILEEP